MLKSLPAKSPRAMLLGATLLCLSLLLPAPAARAEVSEVRIAQQFGLVYLPFMVIKHEKLLEQNAAKAGIPDLKVSWVSFSGGDLSNIAMLSGNVEIVNGGLPAFLTIWAKTRGNLDIKAFGAFNRLPVIMVTRNPKVKTIRDFTDEDRIALPAVRLSGQALLLEMEAAKLFGPDHWDQLDHLTVSRALPDGMADILNEKSQISTHFGGPPYAGIELKKPGYHVVLTERDVLGGPYSAGVTYATQKFQKENPKIAKAYFDSLVQAIKLIDADKRRVAQIYLDESGDKASLDEITTQLSAPDMVYDYTAYNTDTFAQFMYKIGQIKQRPDSWKDLFFPYLAEMPGAKGS